MTSRSEEPEVRVVGARSERVKTYIEQVLERTAGPLSDLLSGTADKAVIDANDAPGGRPGEVEIVLRYKGRIEYWQMTLCRCCDPPKHEGWRLRMLVAVN